ncbi:male-specific lethal 1-like 1 [Amphibalanus amphitrite]|uniref:male-specific lethal 1-like 1 n=1 Tax=Amphibalanus amphitrite TaxID=1232801 RepID=UPI001C92040F|nr:male-specific lethal 1-like 1 [Amphibalanus amphitrite]XP_043222227.1 male-specific lethal 1-like 1 [Amphibalanus amphitrite]XP_043222228.1 male-specific lethal 1-like 1 [Amphibalanus amphitrite]XP_043222229.1 male-specific lethal 1-like 1 [Amphibalanus amphitrite]
MSVYASNCKTTALGPDERHRMEKEIKKLKEMLSIHLDLIQHQADQAATRETQFKALRRENELLLQKMERMERRLSVPARSPGAVPPPPPPPAPAPPAPAPAPVTRVDSATSPRSPVARTSQQTQTSGDERAPTPPVPAPRRPMRSRARRSSAATEPEPSPAERHPAPAPAQAPAPADRPAEISTSTESRRLQRKLYRKGDEPARHRKCMLTDAEYYQYIPAEVEESDTEEGAGRQTYIEIPRWTLNPLTPLPNAEPAESTDDAVFAKRHLKLEVDEKRRKRWDLQRLREQRAYEKLKQSYSRGRGGRSASSGGGSADPAESERSLTLRPPASGALYLQVAPQLPVCAFGSNLPVLAHREFQLPWAPGKAPPLPGARGETRSRR